MGSRALILLAVVALAVLGAVWYAAGSPSQGAGAQVPAEIALSAVQTGSGNWVRYVVTIKNAGDADFSGSLVLLDRSEASVSGGPGTTGDGSGGGTTAPRPTVPKSIPKLPASAPDAGYELHILVPARQLVIRVITAPDRYGTVAVGQDPDGTVVQSAGVERANYVPVAVLSPSPVVVSQLQAVRFDDVTLRVTQYQDARTFPTNAVGLAGFVAVVIDEFPGQSLSDAQRNALRDFVGQGGGLVVAAGADWRRTLTGLPGELVPLHATGTTSASLSAIAALAGRPEDVVTTIAEGDLAPGARAVASEPGGRPLMVAAGYGGGLVTLLAFDPGVEPLASLGALVTPAWSQAVGRVLDHPPGALPTARTVPGVEAAVAQAMPPLSGAELPSPWLVGPLLLTYLLLVAPVNYLVLRRRLRRPDLLWVTAPLIAAVFTGAFYGLGTDLQGGIQDEELQVLRLAPNGSVAQVDYHRVLFRQRGNHELEMVRPGLAAPLTNDLSGTSLELTGLRAGEEHVVPIQRPLVLEKGVVYGSVRVVGAASSGRQPVSVEAHLGFRGGHVVGQVANTGKQAVHGLALYSQAEGQLLRTPLASVIPAGATATVDSVPANLSIDPAAPAIGTKAPPDPMTRIARAVGIYAVTQDTQPYLVGFTDPVASALNVDGSGPARSAIAVWELPVTMESADGEIFRWSAAHLAAVSGERRTGFLDVYDMELPKSAPARLTLSFDKFQYQRVEVFNWAAGSWHNGPWQDEPTNATRFVTTLDAGDLASGLLRVRVKESRIGWASGFYING
jgi:hypothetical protein